MNIARKQQEPERREGGFLSVPERLAKSRQEREAKEAFAAKLTAAPKRRK